MTKRISDFVGISIVIKILLIKIICVALLHNATQGMPCEKILIRIPIIYTNCNFVNVKVSFCRQIPKFGIKTKNRRRASLKRGGDLVHPAGIEPTTFAVGGRHSIQLRYGCILRLFYYKGVAGGVVGIAEGCEASCYFPLL